MRRVLLIRRGGLGDTLLMVPVLRALRARHPGAEIAFAGVLEFAALLQRFGVADRALSTEDLALWALRSDSPAGATARARLAGFAAIVSDSPEVEALAGKGPQLTVFDPRLGPAPRRPAARQLLERCGLRGPADCALVAPRERVRDGPVVLHPGSGAPAKCWPLERFADLARRLRTDSAVRVLLGPAERERQVDAVWPPGVEVITPGDAVDLAERLLAAAAYVGNDSGPTHLAAALRVPTVALFGPTDPAIWAPPGERVAVLASRGAPDQPVDAVLAALASLRGR